MIYLEEKQIQEIIKHCQDEYPHGTCGILAGKVYLEGDRRKRKVEKIYQMENVQDTIDFCYLMNPEEELRVFKEISHLGMEMLGIYHSHPSISSSPSVRDCKFNFYSEVSHVIISLYKDFNNPDIRASKIIEGKIEEEEIVVIK